MNSPEDSSTAAQPARILVVENHEQMRFLLERTLRELGYRVHACAEPRVALETFCSAPEEFDLVLTDFWMPELNGVALALGMFSVRRVPVILLSGFCEGWTDERVRNLGLHALLHKPTPVAELAHAIASALNGGASSSR